MLLYEPDTLSTTQLRPLPELIRRKLQKNATITIKRPKHLLELLRIIFPAKFVIALNAISLTIKDGMLLRRTGREIRTDLSAAARLNQVLEGNHLGSGQRALMHCLPVAKNLLALQYHSLKTLNCATSILDEELTPRLAGD